MDMTNLHDAWKVLCEDNTPVPVPAEDFHRVVVPALTARFEPTQLQKAEAVLGWVRRDGDLEDLESPLWTLCAGEREDQADLLERYPDGGQELDEVLDEMFDCLGLV